MYLTPCFFLRFLQEVPERIDEDVINCCALAFRRAANCADPVDRSSVFGRETDRCSYGVVRDVFLSGAHDSNFY